MTIITSKQTANPVIYFYMILQMELKVNNAVKYIDVKESSFFAYVRCDTAEGAQALAQKSNEERHMTILEGKNIYAYISA